MQNARNSEIEIKKVEFCGPFQGKWWVSRLATDEDERTIPHVATYLYLYPDGTWRGRACERDITTEEIVNHGYYNSKEDAEKSLERAMSNV